MAGDLPQQDLIHSLYMHFQQKQDLIDCVGFNDTSTLVGHFVSSPTEREKRDSRDKREEHGRRRTGMKVK